jgi:hypothetical protein
MADQGAQQQKIDFSTGQFSSVEQLAGASPVARNVLFDDAGAVHLRPGISAWSGFDQPPLYDATQAVIGMHIFQGGLVWVTEDRLIHRLVSDGFANDLSSLGSSAAQVATRLDGSTRPIFANTRTILAIAGSGLLQKWNGTSALSDRLGGSPPSASHVVATSGGLVVNTLGNTGQIQWSATDPESWPALNFKELEWRSDKLSAIYLNTGEIAGIGPESVEMLSATTATVDNAGTLFFTFQSGRTFEWGSFAPYSFIQFDEQFALLDDRKRIVMSDGRGFKVISDPALTSTLQDLETVSDCWGFRLNASKWNLLIWVFPTHGRTFCYDLGKQKWTEWSGFSMGQVSQFAAQSFVTWKDRGLHLVGLSDGTIGKLDFTSAWDSTQPVVGEVTTGFDDNGTPNRKHAIALRMRFRRGLTPAGTPVPPRAQLFWRDDLGAFEGPIELDMGNADDPAPTVEVRALGMYRERQWKLVMSDTVPLTLASAVLEFEVSDL